MSIGQPPPQSGYFHGRRIGCSACSGSAISRRRERARLSCRQSSASLPRGDTARRATNSGLFDIPHAQVTRRLFGPKAERSRSQPRRRPLRLRRLTTSLRCDAARFVIAPAGRQPFSCRDEPPASRAIVARGTPKWLLHSFARRLSHGRRVMPL